MYGHRHSLLCASAFVLFFQSSLGNLPSSFGLDKRDGHLDASGYDQHSVKINMDSKVHHEEFFQFVTRPDIDAPRWNIKTHNASLVAPGYWFLAPYQDVFQSKRGGSWVGPHMYDSSGELIWSGVPEVSDGFDTFDFKVQKVLGEDMLTMMYRHEHAAVMDKNYNMRSKFTVESHNASGNMHTVNVVQDGRRLLMIKDLARSATSHDQQVSNYSDTSACRMRYQGFEEFDIATGEKTFEWSSEGLIPLEEGHISSSKAMASGCKSSLGHDYLHVNGVDRFPDGDYLISSRHASALYKISAQNGTIVWRFGGKKSNFRFNKKFSGQHDARVVSQNATHVVVSFLDNAWDPAASPQYTHDHSRGLIVALRTDTNPMTAETLHEYDHPDGGYAPGRGSLQILPNGNAYIGWTTFSGFSEHSPDGQVLLEASLKPELKSYRSYKYEWTGYPTQPPDVVAKAMQSTGSVSTAIWVSWNGATEVAAWKVYKSSFDGSTVELVASSPRQGFETMMSYQGFAAYVVVEALDKNGQCIGLSDVQKTMAPMDTMIPDVLREEQWLQSHLAGTTMSNPWSLGIVGTVVAFIFGLLVAFGAVAGMLAASKWRSNRNRKSAPPGRSWMQRSATDEAEYEALSKGDETLVEDESVDSEMSEGKVYDQV